MAIIQITRGSEWAADIEWKDDAGVAQDATGASISAILRRKLTGETFMSVGAVWTSASAGQGRLVLAETATALIPLGLLTEIVIKVVKIGTVTDVFTAGDVEGL
jgi:hypothetical protein